MRPKTKLSLPEIARANATSEAIFTTFAVRERNRIQTDLGRLKTQLIKEGFKIVPKEFLATFERLVEAGVGILERGPRGGPGKFTWKLKQAEVGKAGLERSASVPPSQASQIIMVLSGGREAIIPTGLSRQEAERVSKIILQHAS